MEASIFSQTMLSESTYVGSARVEFLARVYYGLRGSISHGLFRTNEPFDGLYVGTPLWIRTPVSVGGVPSAELGGFVVIDVDETDADHELAASLQDIGPVALMLDPFSEDAAALEADRERE
jgi:hypothetical protein